MITNTGKGIITKYLIGQAPAYASYIAVGCGTNALEPSSPFGDYSDQKNLDFEMFRVPIVSRGFVTENGEDKIVLTAELPTEERYEITEVGVYSAGSNPSVGAYDSRIMYAFTENENWEYHSETSSAAIRQEFEPLDSEEDDIMSFTDKVLQTNADNRTFTNTARLDRNERCRFLNNIVMMAGDTAKISVSNTGKLSVLPTWTVDGESFSSTHIHLNGTAPDLNRQSPKDQMRLAFSVVNKNGTETTHPSRILILGEFSSDDAHNIGQYARFEVDIEHDVASARNNLITNRYFVESKELQELTKSSDFSWNAVNTFKMYVCVLDADGNPSPDYYVCLDAIRLESVSGQNPLYGLSGYTVIKNVDARPIVKAANSTNFIEFRFNVGIV